MNTSYGTLFAYLVGIIIIFILGRLFLVPMKFVGKLVINAIIGAVVLLIINFAGGFLNYHIPFNAVSALVVGFLGVPGVIMLIIIKLVFKI